MNDRIDIWQGRDLALSFTLQNSDGTPIDLTSADLVFRAADGLGTPPVFELSSTQPTEIVVTPIAGEAVVNVPALATRDLNIPASQTGPFGAGHGPAHLALDWELVVHWGDGRKEQLAQDVVTVFFGALPAQATVSLSNLTGAQRPAHLNNIAYAQTAYDDVAIGATVNILPVVAACRNSGRDDTSSEILSGGLAIDPDGLNGVTNQTAIVHDSVVVGQSAKLGAGIKGRVRDQYYRTSESAEAGDYAFNASRASDFGLDQVVGIGSPPFTGKAAEPFTDEYAGDSLSNCRIFDGAVEWLANGAMLEVTIMLASNSGQLFQPRLFDKTGSELLFATYGADIDVKLHDGTTFVGPASGDSFGPNASYDLPALNGASSVQARITVAAQTVPPLGAFIMNYKA